MKSISRCFWLINTFLIHFRCSEQPINLNDFRELLPSRCTLGEDFCQITCHAIGRRDGACEYGKVSKVEIEEFINVMYLIFNCISGLWMFRRENFSIRICPLCRWINLPSWLPTPWKSKWKMWWLEMWMSYQSSPRRGKLMRPISYNILANINKF